MHDDAGLSMVVSSFGSACFACFAWGTLRHFVRKDSESQGTWVISLLSLGGFGFFIWRVLYEPLSSSWMLGCFLFVASAGLWGWALAATRATPPTLAFTGDEPRLVLNTGPYRWVRHPFYSAYLLFWTGTAVATPGMSGWAAVLVLGAVYFAAARHEEGKFARSVLAARYADYASCTGMFLPWRWKEPIRSSFR